MKFVTNRQLTWREWDAAVEWLVANYNDITLLNRAGTPCDRYFMTLSKLVEIGSREPECIGYTISGPDDLVVEYIMRWG